MKENVIDVLAYLFETYTDPDVEDEPDRESLRDELEQAGFHDSEIDKALDWLDGLTAQELSEFNNPSNMKAVRIFTDMEQLHLDTASRGYIMYLEQIGILTHAQRELVIDRLMALGAGDIDIEKIKWVVLLVLFSQPGYEAAYARMENLVFEDRTARIH